MICNNRHIFCLFYFYICPPDSQESDGGANTYGRQLPQPASEDPQDIAVRLKFNRDMTVI